MSFHIDKEDLPPPQELFSRGQKTRDDWLQRRGLEDIDSPLQKIAGLTGNEQAAQSLLGDIISGDTFRDPRTSPFFEGFRAESRLDEEEEASRLRRFAQRSGGLRSSGALSSEGKLRARFGANRLSALGQLFEAEAARQDPLRRAELGANIGGAQRGIDQSRYDAQFNKEQADFLAPFQLQAPLLQGLNQSATFYQPQQMWGPSAWGQAVETGGRIAAGVATGGLSEIAYAAQNQNQGQAPAASRNNFSAFYQGQGGTQGLADAYSQQYLDTGGRRQRSRGFLVE